MATGVTWTSRTASAPWAGRFGHTSVVDAAGAIYVIGGDSKDTSGPYYYQDVWASTDGGVHRTRSRGWSGGTGWALKGLLRVSSEMYYWALLGVLLGVKVGY